MMTSFLFSFIILETEENASILIDMCDANILPHSLAFPPGGSYRATARVAPTATLSDVPQFFLQQGHIFLGKAGVVDHQAMAARRGDGGVVVVAQGVYPDARFGAPGA